MPCTGLSGKTLLHSLSDSSSYLFSSESSYRDLYSASILSTTTSSSKSSYANLSCDPTVSAPPTGPGTAPSPLPCSRLSSFSAILLLWPVTFDIYLCSPTCFYVPLPIYLFVLPFAPVSPSPPNSSCSYPRKYLLSPLSRLFLFICLRFIYLKNLSLRSTYLAPYLLPATPIYMAVDLATRL